jgi:hypothetical protein
MSWFRSWKEKSPADIMANIVKFAVTVKYCFSNRKLWRELLLFWLERRQPNEPELPPLYPLPPLKNPGKPNCLGRLLVRHSDNIHCSLHKLHYSMHCKYLDCQL